MKVGVVGAGKWGQALHFAISQKQKTYIASRTPREIKNFVSMEEIMEFEYLVFAISAQNARDWLENKFVFKNQKILVASKGIEVASGKFLNEVFSEFVPEENLAFVSGPSFAAEVMKSLPTAVVISSKNKKLAKKFSKLFPSFIKTYTSKDVIGAEVSGSYKNIIAIASGICDGLELGNNARASLISRGLVEMTRFGRNFGAKKNTFLGLSGSGDLFLTATSVLSRNYRVGLGLAHGKSLEEILEELGEVAEGVYTSDAVYRLVEKHDIYVPIAVEVHRMISGKKPQESLRDLLTK
ncbi:MAG TPA: NAD(P)H-dependent glycerol-3-phosphate dehydrogenase [Campylobacterales bacterium]|nr:NAD(P)H-dependent glycerol-3-phosphate dehydrogenase [Campylobacterales bacterium]HIP59324.1 NAD(P)H-dependent glycerol-3-phosphate dehydrogenase [Campylobacterales bacterium]